MKKALPLFLLSFAVFPTYFCGRKGPIYPPFVKIPKPIEEFQAFQRGDKILLNWNNPTTYTDGGPLEEISRVEIWLFIKVEEPKKDSGAAESEAEEEDKKELPATEEPFPKKARVLATITKETFPDYHKPEKDTTLPDDFIYSHQLSIEDLADKTFTFGLKVWDDRKKESDFSALLSVKPKAFPLPPTGLEMTVSEEKIDIEWSPPEKNIDDSSPADVKGYVIYRKSEEGGLRRLSPDLVRETKFADKDFRFKVAYTYFVRASASDSPPFLESGDSDAGEIVPKDTFPPQRPKGLVGISGDSFISLSWNTNRESDLAGYRVWRKGEDEQNYVALTETIRDSVYNDAAVEKNKRYHYAVSALDKSGNESKKSESIAINSGRGPS
ncbi:MAG: fibronectin type III domain-containing protein [Candidatus Aminicenantes bacterium]|nr:fibronectin type III domain-containing protein [Candidatus Aminicenantes bacterium]